MHRLACVYLDYKSYFFSKVYWNLFNREFKKIEENSLRVSLIKWEELFSHPPNQLPGEFGDYTIAIISFTACGSF